MARATARSLLPTNNEDLFAAAMPGYERALQTMPTAELMDHLTRINGILAQSRQQDVTDLLSRKLEHESQQYASSTNEVTPSRDPMRPAATPSPSRPPSPVELLASSQRIGPRLASKLILASARAQERRNR